MGTTDQIQVMLLQEVMNDVLGKGVAHTAIVQSPTAQQFAFRIGPEKVAEQTALGDVARTLDVFNEVDGAELGRKASVHADDAALDDGADGKAFETIGKQLPEMNIITSFALVVETVDAVDGVRFVVSTQNKEILGIFDFVS